MSPDVRFGLFVVVLTCRRGRAGDAVAMTETEMRANRTRVSHTAHLTPDELRAIREMLDEAFAGGPDGDFTDDDWEHTVGGLHATVWDGSQLVGHGALVQRRLLHGGTALRAGYVEGVAVRAERRGEGHGAAVMAALERCVHRAYRLGALASSEAARGFYAGRGWRPWRGRTLVLAPDGPRRTPAEDDAVFVLPVAGTVLDEAGELTCDWREGDVW